MKIDTRFVAASLWSTCAIAGATTTMTDEEKRKHQEWSDQADQALEGQAAGKCFKSIYPDPRQIEIPCGTTPTKPLGHPPHYRTFVPPENRDAGAPGASSPQPAASGSNGESKVDVHPPRLAAAVRATIRPILPGAS